MFRGARHPAFKDCRVIGAPGGGGGGAAELAWARTLAPIRTLLINKYYFDWFNENVLAAVARGLGFTLWKGGDQVLIDGVLVNGSAATVSWFGSIVRRVQNGYLYSYAFWMIIGLAALLGWFLVRS